jgi:hypothetical protein
VLYDEHLVRHFVPALFSPEANTGKVNGGNHRRENKQHGHHPEYHDRSSRHGPKKHITGTPRERSEYEESEAPDREDDTADYFLHGNLLSHSHYSAPWRRFQRHTVYLPALFHLLM